MERAGFIITAPKKGGAMKSDLSSTAASDVEFTRRGYKIYETNPSLSDHLPTRISHSKPSKLGDAYMVAPGTAEIVARGAFGFVQEKEVDTEEFVKIYLAGIRKYGELSKAGAIMFEYVYEFMSGVRAKDKDTVDINLLLAQRWRPSLTRATYFRGMNELLNKGFIFRSLSADLYFVNIRFMFNGDRLVLVQSYRRKAKKAVSRQLQNELPLDEE
jgi:hypothetical protein